MAKRGDAIVVRFKDRHELNNGALLKRKKSNTIRSCYVEDNYLTCKCDVNS